MLVIGSGIAGMTAARRAQQQGGSVRVLEKGWTAPGFSNSRQSGAGYGAAGESYDLPADELYENVMRITDGHARPDVARAWSQNIGRAFDWQVAEGAVYGGAGTTDGMGHRLQPIQPQVPGRPWFGAGPDRFLNILVRRFKAEGGEFWTGSRARRLIVESGRVTGVVVATSDGLQDVHARAVVMADGGFQGNRELMASYVTTEYLVDGSPLDTGDCLQMALEVGAKTVNMPWFYGHCRHRDALTNSRLTPHPAPGAVIAAGMMVDGSGSRFIDEGLGTCRVAVAIAHSETPGDCWLIFDDRVWNGAAKTRPVGGGALLPVNPTVVEEGGTLIEADTLAGLAEAIPAPMGALEDTVAAYNAGGALEIPRTGQPVPLLEPPFRAMPLIAGVYFTMGGPLVNGQAQVLDGDEKPIEGLYAAGGTMGGLMGGPQAGYAGGWAEASTFGLLAGENAMAALAAGAR